MTPFTILGEVPEGGPGSDTANALRASIPQSAVADVLRAARDVILTATGPRDGMTSPLNVHEFDQAIRAFMPLGHYERAPNQAISVMDYKMYACRVVQRLLHQVTGRPFNLAGKYNSHLAVNAKANALYEALLDVAAEHQVPAFVHRGWDERLASAGQLDAANRLSPPGHNKAEEQREDRYPDRLKKSTVGSPVQAVFAICDAMVAGDPATTRTALIDECVKQGIAFYTARTQVQVWKRARKDGGQSQVASRVESTQSAPVAPRAQDVAPQPGEEVWVTRRRELEQRMRTAMEEQLQQELRRLDGQAVPQSLSVPAPMSRPLPDPSWASGINEMNVRNVFIHLSRHGSINESELVGFLGSPRAARHFSASFEHYLTQVPFLVRIEQLPDGKRYVKEEEK